MPRPKLKYTKEQKEKGERDVPVLFPNTKLNLPAAEIAYYRSQVPFAFAIDRQSIPKSARKKDATGMRRRVETIMDEAREQNLFLPEPHYHEYPIPGQLPYSFEGDCRRFWFVDGTMKRATGYAANQNARPELWRAFLLAQALADHQCGPAWFLVGEGTRLFREPQWLSTFCRALWHKKVRIYSGGFGEVTPDNYSGFEAYIKALSGWLKTVSTGARRVHREEHMLSHTYPPFGLSFTADRRHVRAEPSEWAIVLDFVERLADGRLPSCLAVSRWLKETHGIERSYAWVLEYLKKPYLDGEYICGETHYRQRLITQGGLFYDLDISEGGHPRRDELPQEGIVFPIEHEASGTEPPDPRVLAQARARVIKNVGRPRLSVSRQLWPMRLLRCAVCGYGIEESTTSTNDLPYLMCRCLDNQIRRLRISKAEAQALPICQHARHRPGHASELMFAAMYAALQQKPVAVDAGGEDPAPRQIQLETALARAEAGFMAFQGRCANGEMGDQGQALIRRSVETERAARIEEVDKLRRELELTCSKNLLAQRENVQLQDLARSLAGISMDQFTREKKGELIEAMVRTARLDLATGEFVIELNFNRDHLMGLLPEFITEPGLGYKICELVVRGCLPGRRQEIVPRCANIRV